MKKNNKSESKFSYKNKFKKKTDMKKTFAERISKKPLKSKNYGMRLNQFIAHSGISSRREADKLIKAGLVKVNGKIIVEMGFKVLPKDIVKFNDEIIFVLSYVYIYIYIYKYNVYVLYIYIYIFIFIYIIYIYI